ncbi:Cytosolic non-specific dipeptidase [Aphelenchoides besseyi]|nr:Cytosolic non-specific dipeptidase [Aphelenchoides besseyi]
MVLEKVFSEIDNRSKEFIERLREAVEIPSVSAEEKHRDDVFRMMNWAEKELSAIGVKCQQIENGEQTLSDGRKLRLPPVLFGTLGEDPKKKTILVYGHLDVQPAQKSDGWDTEPFELVVKDGKMYGRGSTDDKGPVVAWINAIEVLNSLNVEIPVNLKFVLEGMEESGSEGLDDVLKKHKDTFLHDVEATCISDNYWLGKNKPCLTYGLRGISYFLVEVSAPKQDLHSGVFGGSIHEPMNSLIHILSTLSDVDGTIKVEGLDKLIAPLTKEEEALYKSIDFNVEDYRSDIGVKKLVSESRETILMNRWRYPALSVHGVEGAFYGSGAKTVIPSKVIGKFSIRLVPNMEPDVVADLVVKYMEKEWKKLQSPCNFKVVPLQGGKPWLADFNHPHYQAGVRAIEKVFKTKPDFTREGGSIPVTLTFQELTGKNVMLLPLGSCDDMAHSQNEKMNVSNYIEGTKTLAAYLLELAYL